MLYLFTALTNILINIIPIATMSRNVCNLMKTFGFLGSYSISRLHVVYRVFGHFCTGFLQVPIYKNAGLHDTQWKNPPCNVKS